MQPGERPALQRLFFALWPDDAVRGQLAQAQARAQTQLERDIGRLLPAENLHLTLAFIGAADAERRACLEQAAARVRGAAFSLQLDRLGYWPRPQVLWAGVSETPAALARLVQDLEQALTACGYRPEARPYQAHVTLARKARQAPAQSRITPIVWPVQAFCLAESVTAQSGARYRVLTRWPL